MKEGLKTNAGDHLRILDILWVVYHASLILTMLS
ncbi:hypothetical protein SAMN05421692_3770 [Chryseobacterium indologenes]|nr:hypothetical protein SAMN05421692_3770 [Chryseobacterium indologenes]SUX51705.1 Uncharacterised protein [Chryseobacterium indologenes]